MLSRSMHVGLIDVCMYVVFVKDWFTVRWLKQR